MFLCFPLMTVSMSTWGALFAFSSHVTNKVVAIWEETHPYLWNIHLSMEYYNRVRLIQAHFIWKSA